MPTPIRRSLPALALALLVLSACGDGKAAPPAGAAAAAAAGGGGGGAGGRGGPGGMRAPAVETAAVTVGSIAREVTVSGQVQPLRSVGVNSQVAGALLAVAVEEGSAVRAGQVLARLDDRELAAQVRSAESNFAVTRSAYERAEQLRQRQVITQAEYERDRAAHEAARAQLDQLRTRLGYATLRSPITGVVTRRAVQAGDIVGAQQRLFDIADLSTLVVPVNVSELDVVQLSPGAPARVTLDAYPGRALGGTIRRIFPSADPATRLVPVEVELRGEAARLARPGFLARVSLALGTRAGVRLIPASAVVGGAGEQVVYLLEEGSVRRHPIEVGLISQGQVEVLSGLEAGQIVVTVGNNNLREGQPVRVVEGPGMQPGGGTGGNGARRTPPAQGGA